MASPLKCTFRGTVIAKPRMVWGKSKPVLQSTLWMHGSNPFLWVASQMHEADKCYVVWLTYRSLSVGRSQTVDLQWFSFRIP